MAAGAIGGNVLGGWLGDRFPKATIFVATQIVAGALALAVFSLPIGLVASATGGALFGLVNASSRPAMLALGTELSPRHRGTVLGLLSLTNQGGIVLGSALGGVAVDLGGSAGRGPGHGRRSCARRRLRRPLRPPRPRQWSPAGDGMNRTDRLRKTETRVGLAPPLPRCTVHQDIDGRIDAASTTKHSGCEPAARFGDTLGGGGSMSYEYEPDEDPIVTADDIAQEASGQLVIEDDKQD